MAVNKIKGTDASAGVFAEALSDTAVLKEMTARSVNTLHDRYP